MLVRHMNFPGIRRLALHEPWLAWGSPYWRLCGAAASRCLARCAGSISRRLCRASHLCRTVEGAAISMIWQAVNDLLLIASPAFVGSGGYT